MPVNECVEASTFALRFLRLACSRHTRMVVQLWQFFHHVFVLTSDSVLLVGYHFVIFIKGTPYAKMLAIAGGRFSDLLKNLNALHGTPFNTIF